jgi:hypothetical protein
MLRFHPVRPSKKSHKSDGLFQAADDWSAVHARQMASNASTNVAIQGLVSQVYFLHTALISCGNTG